MLQQILSAEYNGEGLGAFVKCDNFTVLILNFLPRLVPEKTLSMQKHTETDECFILLSGRAILFTADGIDFPDKIEAHVLQPSKIYKVPSGIWHTPVMSEDAKILLVEKNNTVSENSPRHDLNEEQLTFIRSFCGINL